MIEAITVERFRGLQHLEVEGFGRVNLILGKNNCGKTALMEALSIARAPAVAAKVVVFHQHLRNRSIPVHDFERFWRPLFWKQDADQGLALKLRVANSRAMSVELRKSQASSLFIDGTIATGALPQSSWTIDTRAEQDGQELKGKIVGSSAGLHIPSGNSEGSIWASTGPDISENDVRNFSNLKQVGRDADLAMLLREIDANVSGIELLSPSGTQAELYVRLAQHDGPSLPMSMMGEGFQRCFGMGVSALAGDTTTLFIDEIDNGLHHSTLTPVWSWLATVSAKRNLQVFATTHSEECIAAASRAFTAANDDGLRVIRLDRRQDKTVAAVYNRDLVETAIAADVEIRG
jgi:ABC-type cobalamin/Fe3+-siderophores transport system ATPase subunit